MSTRRFRVKPTTLPGSIVTAFALAICLVWPSSVQGADQSHRFLFFHVDGMSSSLFFEELDAGRLPNIARAVAGGGRIEKALSLFPGGTEMIYPRLKRGIDSSLDWPVGWQTYDREERQVLGRVQGFLKMASFLPPLARYQLLDGFGRGDLAAGLAMQNIPRLLDTHRVVEFFWFATDGAAHLSGKDAQLRSLHNFDRWLGRLWPSLDLDGLNILFYGDHGMSFSRGQLDVTKAIKSLLGREVIFYCYPNVYLVDPSHRVDTAKRLAQMPEIDFAFARVDSETVVGFSKAGRLQFTSTGGKTAYAWTGNHTTDTDPLDYAACGYDGRPLSDEEWLELTATSPAPALPASIFRLLANPYAGDAVVVINPPKRDTALLSFAAGHMGVTPSDLLAPVLFKGPDLAPLEGLDSLWLHTMYARLPDVPLEPAIPPREEQSLSLTAPGDIHLTLSPAYKWAIVADSRQANLLAEYVIFDTYLWRLWAGAGASWRDPADFGMATSVKLEYDVGRASLSFRALSDARGGEREAAISYRLTPGFTLSLDSRGRVGVAATW